jgi:long-chain acyl-CoA synthetase
MEYRNLAELHRRQCERLGPRVALRYKRLGLYHDVTWDQYRASVVAAAAALIDAGVKPGDRVGVLAENCVEWLMADVAILAVGAVNMPPHAPLTARQVHFQMDDAGVSWLFVSNQGQLDKIRQVRAELPKLRGIVVFDARATADDAMAWSTFLRRGRDRLPQLAGELARRETAIGGDDLATIIYTSGTTGNPKGVMLTHGNLLSNAVAALSASPRNPNDILLSWLPYSHIYARTVDHYETIVAGITICLAENPETLIENLAETQPTHFTSVPRFYEKVLAAVSSPDRAETAKRLRRVFGARIDWLSSGGAPLPPAIAKAYQECGLLVLQGYGLTESSPVISFNRKDNYRLDTVGQAIPGIELKIAPDGEVLSRGPHIMKGYWNNPQATAESLVDGWLHTGDLGELDADGFLKITGRKKELMVLSNGKKLVPTHIEGLILGDSCFDQVVVHGEGRNFLSALVVPQWDNLRRAMKAEGADLDSQPPEQLAKDPAVAAFLQKRIDAALKDVANWEQVRKFIVLPTPFTVAADELTVSLKLRRNVILGKHKAALEALYRDAGPDAAWGG